MENKTKKNVIYSLIGVLSVGALVFSLLNFTGCTGLRGPKGDTGAQGEKGDQGEQGDPGIDGEKGDTGSKGDTGAQGEKGDQGEKGETGEKGDTGATGEKGDKGDKGDKGETGSKGNNGTDYYSNTILPSKYGYITVDKGSAYYGESITFKVNITDSDVKVFAVKFNNSEELSGNIKRQGETKTFNIEKTMAKNGYVVQLIAYTNLSDAIDTSENVSLSTDIDVSDPIDPGYSNSNIDSSLLSSYANYGLTTFAQTEYVSGNIEINKNVSLNLNGFNIKLNDNKQIVVKNGATFDAINTSNRVDEEAEDLVSDITSETTDAVVYVNDTGNTTGNKTTLTVGDRVSINGGSGTAIKQDGGNSNVTISEGSTITGKANGIEVRGGTLTINGGTISSSATSFDDESKTGAGIAIIKESDESPNISVDINKGTIKADGGYAIYESGNSSSESSTTGKVNINIDSDGDNVSVESNNSSGTTVKTDETINNSGESKAQVYYVDYGKVTINENKADIVIEKDSGSKDTNNTALKNALNTALSKLPEASETSKNTINIKLPVTTGESSYSLAADTEYTIKVNGNNKTVKYNDPYSYKVDENTYSLKNMNVSIEGTVTKDEDGNITGRTKYYSVRDGKTDETGGNLKVFDNTFDDTESVTFKDIEFIMNTSVGEKSRNGFGGKNFSFDNCKFTGILRYVGQNGETTFTDCEFNESTVKIYLFYLYNIQKEYTFDGCTFNATNNGRFFNIYKNEGEHSDKDGTDNYSNSSSLKISNCTFNGKPNNDYPKPILCLKLADRANWEIYFNVNNTINNIGKYALETKTNNKGTSYQTGDGFTYQEKENYGTNDIDVDDGKINSEEFIQKGYGYLNYKGHAIYGIRCDGSHSWRDPKPDAGTHPDEVGSAEATYASTKIYLVDENGNEEKMFDGSEKPTEENNNKTID